MTKTATATTTTTAVDRLLDVVAMTHSPTADDVFAADAVLDATVPGWRFSVAGERIGYQLAEWFRDPAALEEPSATRPPPARWSPTP